MKRYLKFIKDSVPQNTWTYYVRSEGNGDLLGTIKYFGRWRQYCFFPVKDTVFSAGCLVEIDDYLKKVNAEWRDLKTAIKRGM